MLGAFSTFDTDFSKTKEDKFQIKEAAKYRHGDQYKQ
jgi:hypothetical protein